MYQYQAHPGRQAVWEKNPPFWRRKEQSLADWWFQQSERVKDLVSTEGERLIVLDRGTLNDGPGPDVRDVRLLFDDLEMSGDVEFHLSASMWYDHGHDTDEAYNRVILHVVNTDRGGPDLPTLLVQPGKLGSATCIARAPEGSNQLLWAATTRFQAKLEHIQALGEASPSQGHSLFLGLIECMASGPRRHILLQHAATLLGMETWPGSRKWEGSAQSRLSSGRRWQKILGLMENYENMNMEPWQAPQLTIPGVWSDTINPFSSLGVSRNQFNEWLVNSVFPACGFGLGFEAWTHLNPFRHYGFERELVVRLGIKEVQRISDQQALIWWQRNLCRPRLCHSCPLSQWVLTLPQVN